jgi:dienelactone hydrolase
MRMNVTHLAALFILAAPLFAADPTRVLDSGKQPEDSRLSKVRTLNDKNFDMKVPQSREAWEQRRTELREQILVALGLWPMPEKTPLQPVIHGKIDRDEYTIEKVYFASLPGHYVSGSLYRPKGKTGKLPGVLCPHGHWKNGRFFEAPEAEVEKQMKIGGEKTTEGARYPLQARCATLARMGCVVFHYDMVGVADSTAIGHREGFLDAEADLRLQNFMGLQTWNSIRALDFLLGLPDVDRNRIGVTGASGGGTQTFILCAIDDRPRVAFPAVMVSTEMQGGCICENAPYLRQGAGNIDIAGLFAPKPLGMTGAHDWTINIEKHGLPELKALYKLYGAEDMVLARCFPEFEHNYNQVSREVMYSWLNKHLQLGLKEPVAEQPFKPVPPKDLAVYDHGQRPEDEVNAVKLRQYLTEASDKQMLALQPKDGARPDEYRRIVGTALRVMIQDRPGAADAEAKSDLRAAPFKNGVMMSRFLLGRKDEGDRVPALVLSPSKNDGTVVIWVHPEGKKSVMNGEELTAAAQQIVDGKAALLAIDTLLTGETATAKPPAVDDTFSAYTFGYNRPLLSNRVHDIVTAVAYAKQHLNAKKVYLVGFDRAGPWTVLAAALCGDAVARTAADFDGFRFEKVTTSKDEMMLPGALKYGGLPAFASLSAPNELLAFRTQGCGSLDLLRNSFRVAGAQKNLKVEEGKLEPKQIVDWLMR